MIARKSIVLICLMALATMAACGEDAGDDEPADDTALHDPSDTFTADELAKIATLSPAQMPQPTDPTNAVADDPGAATLGQFLYFDTRLSGDGEQSCATCHQPDHGFADPKKLSEAMGTTARHAPTVLNAAFNRWYFWDGRTDSLWAQATQPLENPAEQGTNRLAIAHLVARDQQLRQAYEDIFGALPNLDDTDRFPENGRPVPSKPDGAANQAWASMSAADQKTVNRIFTNVTKAIGAYEMKIVSFDSPFDRYVDGLRTGDEAKLAALSDRAKRGLKLFVGEAGCTNCHDGALFTNYEFQNLGFEPRNWLAPEDTGRYDGISQVKADPFNAAGEFSDGPDSERADELRFLAQNEESRGQFKVPTLRNVELTAPYMHGGHFATLEDVVRFYSQLDEAPVLVGHRSETLKKLDLDDQQVADLVAFLKSLTGAPLPAALTEPPSSPASAQ